MAARTWRKVLRKHPVLYNAMALAAGLLMAALLVVVIEGLSVAMRSARGLYVYPFLVVQTTHQATRTKMDLRHLDPHLGYTSNRPFEIFGDTSDPTAFRILTLGGSTADTGFYPLNWPRQLYDHLTREGYPVVVFNGGISGYTTSQELLKLIRDGLLLEPDLVISVNGVNDWGNFLVAGHPMVNTYQHYLLRELTGQHKLSPPRVMPNTITLIRDTMASRAADDARLHYDLGLPSTRSNSEQWLFNMQHMRAAAAVNQATFLAYRQPALRYGGYQASDEQEDPAGVRFRVATAKLAQGVDWIVDLTECLDGDASLYSDHVHLTEAGNARLTAAIMADLESRGILPEQ